MAAAAWPCACGESAPAPKLSPLAFQGPKPLPITPPSAARLNDAIERGVAFLLKKQNKDGSWGSARRTKGLNIYAPVPGAHHAFRSAVTGIVLSTLCEYAEGKKEESKALRKAIERGRKWMLKEMPRLRRATPDALYNVWGHGFGLQGLVRLRKRSASDRKTVKKIDDVIRGQLARLKRYETVAGGWCYYDFSIRTARPGGGSSSFTTATVLVALKEVQDAGFKIEERLIKRAMSAIHLQRKADFSYAYGEHLRYYPMYRINRPGGSLGRSQACNAALRIWHDPKVVDGVMKAWLNRLIARNLWLDIGRKRPIPHESWFAVAGYFFYFGHYYAARCIEMLPEKERAHFQEHLAHILIRLQEKDGSWWDYPLYDYHQPYGTGFAVMSLLRCRKTAPRSSNRPKPKSRPRNSTFA